MSAASAPDAPTSTSPLPASGDVEVPVWWRILRGLLGLLILAALTQTVVTSFQDGTAAQNISYFTFESNLLLALVLVIGALVARRRLPSWWDTLRGAAAFYLVMTGLIYAVVIAPLSELLVWDIGWTGVVLHRVAPVLALIDWAAAPIARRAGWSRPLLWLIYPVLYLGLTWVRGAITGWYPYDFLDPTGPGGWGMVAVMTVVVLVAFLVVGALLHLIGRSRTVTSGTSQGSRGRSSPASPSRT